MSQSMSLSNPANPNMTDAVNTEFRSADLEQEFDYRPVPVLAPVSAFLGLASLICFVTIAGVVIGLLGALLSVICLLQIRRARGHLGGRGLALFGLVTSVAFPVAGSGMLYREYVEELPEGYQRVSFVRDISEKQFVFAEGRRQLHPDVKPLVDEPVFVKGFIYQTKQSRGLKSFVLLKDNGECCFGGDPQPYDMIGVRMVDGKTVDGVDGLVSVGGILRANPDALPGEPVYVLEADYFSKARTSF